MVTCKTAVTIFRIASVHRSITEHHAVLDLVFFGFELLWRALIIGLMDRLIDVTLGALFFGRVTNENE
jgi:hypothetical protein